MMRICTFIAIVCFFAHFDSYATPPKIKSFNPNYSYSNYQNKKIFISKPAVKMAEYRVSNELQQNDYSLENVVANAIQGEMSDYLVQNSLNWSMLPANENNSIHAYFQSLADSSLKPIPLPSFLADSLKEKNVNILIVVYDVACNTSTHPNSGNTVSIGRTSVTTISPGFGGEIPPVSRIDYKCAVYNIESGKIDLLIAIHAFSSPLKVIEKANKKLFKYLLYEKKQK